MRKRILFLSMFLAISYTASSQEEFKMLWTGMLEPQSEMPQGNAPIQKVERVAPKEIKTTLTTSGSSEWVLNDGWRMMDNATIIDGGKAPLDPNLDVSQWYNATVPGTVLTTLVNQGVYPDPYFGLNNMAIPESLARSQWWYRIEFDAPESDLKNSFLLFNGINYGAIVYLNGTRVGEMKGAFKRGEFDVTDVIKPKGNILTVNIIPTANPGIPHEQTMALGQGLNGGMLSNDGPTFISSIGWDWIPGIRDRNIGLWQDVRLRQTGGVVIGDPLVVTNLPLPDTSYVDITIKTPIKNISSASISGVVRANIEGKIFTQVYTLKGGEESEIVLTNRLSNPRLWWPNGYGSAELYNVELSVTEGDKVADVKDVRFGVRELSYELMVNRGEKENVRYAFTPVDRNDTKKPLFDYINRVKYSKLNNLPTLQSDDLSGLEELDMDDPVGPYLVIRVNGERIFCRGGNWGMNDAMKRVERSTQEPYFRLQKQANFNMIRNWTGESTDHTFYELCDEYGMLVWNDFWITTDDTVEPYDHTLFVDNARDVVRRFRNHPSIAVWNPRNEGFAPDGLDVLLPEMMAQEDNTRHYHGQSRFLNMDGSGPWGYFKNPADYYTQNAKGFNTELGTYAIPTANTIRKFIGEEDLWPINDVWAYHDLHHTTQNFDDFMAAVYSYGEPNSMEEFSLQSQLVCYDAWRNIMEAWNSKMWNNTTGLLLWMSHPAWPSMIWQTYTYDYETPGSYFGIKKACEPIHVQMNLPDNDVVVINSTQKELDNAIVEVLCYGLDGKLLDKKVKTVNAAANSLTPVFVAPAIENQPMYLARVVLKDKKGGVITINDYIKSADIEHNKELNSVAEAVVKHKVSGNKITLTNSSSNIALLLKVSAVDKSTGEVILPAFFSDGYINLLPKERRTITCTIDDVDMANVEFVVEGYNVN